MKPIRLSDHTRLRCLERGATEAEVCETISHGSRETARRGKWQSRLRFEGRFGSPIDGIMYNEKTVEAVFADEEHEIVVVTVKVYYAGREELHEN